MTVQISVGNLDMKCTQFSVACCARVSLLEQTITLKPSIQCHRWTLHFWSRLFLEGHQIWNSFL